MKRTSSAFELALAQLDRGLLRRRRATVEVGPAPHPWPHVIVDGQSAVDFCSNNYLGLAHHPAVCTAMAQAAIRYGAGSTASHLVTGHGPEHAHLEEELAAFTGRGRALVFSTGYMANLAVVSALVGRGEVALLDRLSHASLIDGALLCGGRLRRFAHGDAQAAERELADPAVSLVATDGVFSMDGDCAPLPALARLSGAHGAWLVVDDAHGIGVLGSHGRGALEHFGLDETAVPVLVGTLGKAFGTFGAFVAGPADLIEFLIQKSRTYRYTTALPPPVAAATRAALVISERESWRRERLRELTRRFRHAAEQLDIPLADSDTPIQPVILGSSAHALRAQEHLLAAGFHVAAIRPPTVPTGSARLRITLSAVHEPTQVDALVEALGHICATVPA